MIILGHHCVAILLAKILIWAPFSQSMCTFSFCINSDIYLYMYIIYIHIYNIIKDTYIYTIYIIWYLTTPGKRLECPRDFDLHFKFILVHKKKR